MGHHGLDRIREGIHHRMDKARPPTCNNKFVDIGDEPG